MQYYGFCTTPDSKGDVQAILFIIDAFKGPLQISAHMSSGASWAERDIREWHYKSRATPEDSFKWLGQLTPEQLESFLNETTRSEG